jgi:hypothetical protein
MPFVRSLRRPVTRLNIVSPFDSSSGAPPPDLSDDDDDDEDGMLPLTYANVEKVLDTMRPYLIADGGNVKVKEVRRDC